jgi:recombination protein U
MNYPNKKSPTTKTKNLANLGMTLESDIDATNTYYLVNGLAVVHKKPTPVQIVTVSYPARNKAKITEAYYKTPSTTDYNGIYRGKYIDFDAKETNSATSIPLANIHEHQIKHLKDTQKHGGVCFMIVHWKVYNEYYLIFIDDLLTYWDQKRDGRKSIPYQFFKTNAHLIKFGYAPRLNYLEILNKLVFND